MADIIGGLVRFGINLVLDNLRNTILVFGSLYSIANEDVIGEVPI